MDVNVLLSESLSSICKIFSLDIMELWSYNLIQGDLRCIQVYVSDRLKDLHPESANMYLDSRNSEVSSLLCLRASESNYVWTTQDDDQTNCPEATTPFRLLPPLNIPIRTEMACKISRDFPSVSIFVVGYSMKHIKFKSPYLKFLSGIGYTICVALEESIPEFAAGLPIFGQSQSSSQNSASVMEFTGSTGQVEDQLNRNRCEGTRSSWF